MRNHARQISADDGGRVSVLSVMMVLVVLVVVVVMMVVVVMVAMDGSRPGRRRR